MRGKHVVNLVLVLFIGLWAAQASASEQRQALIIGNGAYSFGTLNNPVHDAQDVARALAETGFQVDLVLNATRKDMLKAVRDFGVRIENGGVGLFFYAGHGLQVQGENFLVPVDAAMTREDEVEDYCLNVSAILRKMESAGNRLNVIVLDACRNNPFIQTRGGAGGLAKMDAPAGSLLAYATAPGAVASDGHGQNGLYTSKFLKHLQTPGLEIGQMFRRIRVDVMAESRETQVPWESSSLTGSFFFVPETSASASTPSPPAIPASKHTGPTEPRKLVTEKTPTRAPGAEGPPALQRIAVLYFDNSGQKPELAALRKGLADMVITDLSRLDGLSVVEREKLEAVIQEQELQRTASFDARTAVTLGRLLGARIILTGAFFEMAGSFRIDARMIDVETGKILKAEGVTGKTEDFFNLKDQLVARLARNLNTPVPQNRPGEGSAGSFDQVMAYSKALELLDSGNPDQARAILADILTRKPDFSPAQTLLAHIDR